MCPFIKLGLAVTFVLLLSDGAAAQSGRVKTPAEQAKPATGTGLGTKIGTGTGTRPPAVYVPTQVPSAAKPVPSPPAGADDGSEVIKVASTLVPIPVSVVDSGGRAVTNLKIADFELLIDGKKAEISDLTHSETPVRVAMLFDNSSSVSIAREFEKQAAIKFFRRLIRPEKDLAALYSVSTVTRLEQPLTADILALTGAIENFPPPVGATALLDGLMDSAEYLRSIAGRRVVIIVSDGDDTASEAAFETVAENLQLVNVQVFVVKTTDFENFQRTRSRSGSANLRQLAAERRMLELARQTGGAVYSPLDERELDDAFRQISLELSQQYVLSYYPDGATESGDVFRSITLSVKGRPGLTVRARKGYVVPARQSNAQ